MRLQDTYDTLGPNMTETECRLMVYGLQETHGPHSKVVELAVVFQEVLAELDKLRQRELDRMP